MMLRSCLLTLVLGFSALLAAAEIEKPNVLFIVADDLGWADVGWHNSKIKTPNLDKLVNEGVELDQHYVQPVCTPTRTALLTGRYPSRFGPQALVPNNIRAFNPGTMTLASAMKSVGYHTALSGKWHLGSRPEWGPNHNGFDQSYGSLAGAADPWTHQYRPGKYAKTWHRDEQPLEEEGNATELVGAQAAKWISELPKPWFIYVPFQAVHIPIDAPDEFKRLYEDVKFHDDQVKNESAMRYATYVSQMDAKVGALIEALEKSGQRANTLVVFTSDNGGLTSGANPYIGNVKPTPALGGNLPLRGVKAQLYEGGIRVPAFANWPGKLSARKVTAPMHVVDWFPTLATVAGYAVKPEYKLDGNNVWPLLSGEKIEAEPRTIYWPYTSSRAVRSGNWKLILFNEKRNPRAELYNLADDPYEKNDLAEKETQRVSDLRAKLAEFEQADRKTLPDDLNGETEH